MSAQEPLHPEAATRRQGSWLRTVKAVAWSFVGIRKNSDYQEDTARLSIFHILAVGLIGVVVLVLGLIALVHWVVQ